MLANRYAALSLYEARAAGREKPGMIDLRSVRWISGDDLPEEIGP